MPDNVTKRFRADPLYFEKTERQGLTIWYRQDPSARTFRITVIFRNGGSLSSPSFAKWDTAHLLEHLQFHAIETPVNKLRFTSEKEFDDFMERKAYTSNATVDNKCVAYYISGLNNDYQELTDLMGGIIKLEQPTPDAWKLAVKHIYSELNKHENAYKGNIYYWEKRLVGKQIRMLNNMQQRRKWLNNISPDDVIELYNRAYVSENCRVIIYGNFPRYFLDQLPRYLKLRQAENQAVPLRLDPVKPPSPKKDVLRKYTRKYSSSGYYAVASVSAKSGTLDRILALALHRILHTALSKKIREQGEYVTSRNLQLCLSDSHNLIDLLDYQLFEIFIKLRKDANPLDARQLLQTTISDVFSNYVYIADKITAQLRVINMQGNSHNEIMNHAICFIIESDYIYSLRDELELVKGLTPAALEEYVRKYLSFEKMYEVCFDPAFNEIEENQEEQEETATNP